MPEVSISAEPRTEFGKGAARRTRRADKVPAVIYGHGQQPRHVSIPGHDLMLALKGGANTLLRLRLDGGGSELVLPKAVQRDPIKGFLRHVDLVIVRSGETVTVDVAVHLTGSAAPDGLVDQQLTTLSVQAEATHIPSGIDVSVEGMAVGRAIHAGQVTLPTGTTLVGDPEAVVIHVLGAPSAEEIDAELAGAEAELGAGGAGAAAQAAAREAAEGEAAEGDTGEGDIVPDSATGAGGPAESQTPRE